MDKTTAAADADDMKTIVQVNIYRLHGDTPEFLLFRNKDENDHFWQPVSQEVIGDGDIGDTMKQALEEQAGVRSYKRLSQEMYTYEWYAPKDNGGQQGRDIVFAAELETSTEVTAHPDHYDDFAWLPYDEAVQHLKWNGNKEALRRLRDQIAKDIIAAADSKAKNPAPEYTAQDTFIRPVSPQPAASTADQRQPSTAAPFQDPYAPYAQPVQALESQNPYDVQPQPIPDLTHPYGFPPQLAPPPQAYSNPYGPPPVRYTPPVPTVIPIPIYQGPGAPLPENEQLQAAGYDQSYQTPPYDPNYPQNPPPPYQVPSPPDSGQYPYQQP